MALADALTRFLEADAATTRDRYTARKLPAAQSRIAAIFRRQGKWFLDGFGRFRATIDADAVKESLDSSDWLPLWMATAGGTSSDFSATMAAMILDALIIGGDNMMRSLDVDGGELSISWDLDNPRAIAYAEAHAAAQVTKIDDATRLYLNSMISQAVADGTSYTRLSEMIAGRFIEFATGGNNPRSRRIAIYELGDAYEAGQEQMARELMKAGIPLEKKWLTVGDDRVRPSHRSNQAQGWINYDDNYSSGDFRPPSDPGCRCVTLTRRKKTV